MFDTKVIGAPNSPRLRANESSAPVMIPGSISGSVTLANTQAGFAPSVAAAASTRASIASTDRRMARTINGNPITAAATAAPVQRNATTTPKVLSSHAPTGPLRPSRSSRK
jgi:hypothetical protein